MKDRQKFSVRAFGNDGRRKKNEGDLVHSETAVEDFNGSGDSVADPVRLDLCGDCLNKDSVLEVVNTKRGYTVMIWDEKDEQWFGVEHCKAPELLRDALLDGYRDFLEQQLTHNRRSLTETEILDIQNRCEQLYDLCGE